MPSFCLQEEPATPRELGLGLGLGLKEKEEAVVAAAAGLEEASAAVAVGAGATPAGPAVIGPSLPLALAMPLPEPEPLPLPLEVVRGLLPPLRIPELLSLRPRPRPPRPEPPPGLMALEVSREQSSGGQKGLDGQTAAHGLPHTETQVIFCPWRYEGPRKLEGMGEHGEERGRHTHTPDAQKHILCSNYGDRRTRGTKWKSLQRADGPKRLRSSPLHPSFPL